MKKPNNKFVYFAIYFIFFCGLFLPLPYKLSAAQIVSGSSVNEESNQQLTRTKISFNDATIATNIKNTLKKSNLDKGVVVNFANNQATLSGEVDTTEQVIRIAEITRSVVGVKKIINHLIINIHNQDKLIASYTNNLVLSSEIKKQLFIETDIPLLAIEIKVTNEHVVLTGNVKNKAQILQVEDIVKQIAGVVSVVNHLVSS